MKKSTDETEFWLFLIVTNDLYSNVKVLEKWISQEKNKVYYRK